MLERATTRALPVLNKAVDIVPAAQACCGACRTCLTTNVLGLFALAGSAVAAPLARFAGRIARSS